MCGAETIGLMTVNEVGNCISWPTERHQEEKGAELTERYSEEGGCAVKQPTAVHNTRALLYQIEGRVQPDRNRNRVTAHGVIVT
jgi:hypothetical protein